MSCAGGDQEAHHDPLATQERGHPHAKKNPRFAHEQLSIKAKIFEAHYNQPALEDRLESRDILPGAVTAAPRTPDEMIGQAWLKYSQRRLSRAEFEATILHAEKLKAAPSTRVPETSAYG